MRHYRLGDAWGMFAQPQAWLFVLAVLVLVIVVVALLARRTRDARVSGGAAIPEDLDSQLKALLAQAGGALNQDQIRDYLDIPVADVAQALHALEKSGEIIRSWDADAYTYRVKRA